MMPGFMPVLEALGSQVQGFITTRGTRVLGDPYSGFNLGAHAGEDPRAVLKRREELREILPAEPLWLTQVHGNRVVTAEQVLLGEEPQADGAVTWTPGFPLVIQTADCLPVLCAQKDGQVIGAFHAGWKGLLAGILENGIAAMACPPQEIHAWIGPGISQKHYQVGPEIREKFQAKDPAYGEFFAQDGPDHWRFDLPGCAQAHLKNLGIQVIFVSKHCTFGETETFYSFRRENPCGRMGSFLWISPKDLS